MSRAESIGKVDLVYVARLEDMSTAVREYIAARDKLRGAHEARLAVGIDWSQLADRLHLADERLEQALAALDDFR